MCSLLTTARCNKLATHYLTSTKSLSFRCQKLEANKRTPTHMNCSLWWTYEGDKFIVLNFHHSMQLRFFTLRQTQVRRCKENGEIWLVAFVNKIWIYFKVLTKDRASSNLFVLSSLLGVNRFQLKLRYNDTSLCFRFQRRDPAPSPPAITMRTCILIAFICFLFNLHSKASGKAISVSKCYFVLSSFVFYSLSF